MAGAGHHIDTYLVLASAVSVGAALVSGIVVGLGEQGELD
jgi:hypothetical protein